ncbi:lipopolysaccharide biosynthesis protein [Halobacillus andaensis]|uniref:lipopolysaccharide biosynthesis protein n=1 Tax=Halobacillus andaensis TaxID=1176239 RepID=UPI003D735673
MAELISNNSSWTTDFGIRGFSAVCFPQEFGIIAVANMVIQFSIIFTQVGIGPAIIQKKELKKTDIQAGFHISVILSIIFYFVVFFAAPSIENFFEIDNIEKVIQFMSLSFIFLSLGIVAQSLLERKFKFKELFIVELYSYSIGFAIIGVILGVLGYGVWALAIAKVTQSALRSILLLYFERHTLSFKFHFEDVRFLLNFSGGVTLSRIFNYIALQSDKVIVGRILGATSLGLYERSHYIMSMSSTFVGKIVDKVMYPEMTKEQDNKIKLTSIYFFLLSISHLVVLPLVCVLILLVPEVIRVLFGENWMGISTPLRIILFITYLKISVRICDMLIRAKGAVYKGAFRKGIFTTLVIIASLIGVNWGITGVAIGVVIANIFNYGLSLTLTKKLLEFKWIKFIGSSSRGILLSVLLVILNMPILEFFRMIEMWAIFSIILLCFVDFIIFFILLINFPRLFGDFGNKARSLLKKLEFTDRLISMKGREN